MRGVPIGVVWQRPWLHCVALSGVTLVVLLEYGLWDYPIVVDRAYFTYLGQAVLRGEPIYHTTFLGYPPLPSLLAAASMRFGQGFALPTYLAPRFAGILAVVSSVVLLYVFSRRASGSAWAGVLAGLALASFAQLSALALGTLEPKVLVLVFQLAACLAVQRGLAAPAGLASALAASCWPPALLLAPATLAGTFWGDRRRRGLTLARYGGGMLVGLLPTIVYLTLTDSWWAFWQRAVVIPAQFKLPDAGTDPLYWISIATRGFPREIAVFAAAATGFLGFAIHSLRNGARGIPSAWLDPRFGGMPILTLIWIAFNSYEFQSYADMLPLLPVVAFWFAWASHRVTSAVASTLGHSHAFFAGLAGVVAWYGFSDAFVYAPSLTLGQQKALVTRIVGSAGPEGEVMSFSASEVYVLAERPSPNRFLRLDNAFAPFAYLIDPRGCEGVVKRTVERRPAVIVVRAGGYQGRCVAGLQRQLVRNGYGSTTVQFPLPKRGGVVPGISPVQQAWHVYRRTDTGWRGVEEVGQETAVR